MSEPLDVSLRVRMRYEAGDGAARATTDLEKVRTTAERLGTAAAGGERLNQGLRNTSTLAQAVQADLLRLSGAATRLGSGEVGGRLATGLKEAGQAAGGAAREITQLGQAAARFGAVSTVSYLARDLKAVHAPVQAAKRDLDALREATDKVGRGTGLRDLEADLQKAARRADDLERRLAGVNRRAGGRGGHGEHMEFANEALRASGLGVGGLRFGMGGAAAGGLAAGGALAATGGAIAMATGQAISFEHAMTEVKKAVNDTPEGLRSLERDILGFSRATGLAKNEIAALVAQAGYLNVPRDQLKGFAEIATKAAVGFQMRPEETGEALGHLRAAYGLKDNAQLRSAGDAINTIGDHVGTRERDVLNYLNRTSGVAGMLRIPLAKNAAIGGAVMSLGVAPDVAATGFDSLSGRLANANLEGKDFQRGLRAIHLSGRRAKAMMQEDATGGLIEVLERLKDLPEAKRINAIRDIAGEGNVAAVSRMVESLDKLKEALALVADPSKYAGSLEKTFKIFSSDTQAQIKRAEAAMESWAAKIGSKFSPAVSAAAAAVERWFNAMSKAMDRQEQAEGIARRMAKGGVPTPEEQARIDADPRLKKSVDERLFYQRRADEIEAGRKRLIDPPAEGAPLPPSMGEARDAFRRKAEEFERRRRGETLPGTGKRSDLQEGVKASLASYHDEVDESLTRTERLVREFGRRMREDLDIRPKVLDAAFRFGGGDGARIEHASIGGGSYISGGLGGLGGVGAGGRSLPGRFGGALPMPRGGGGRHGSEGGSAGGGTRRGGSSEPAEDGPTEGIPGALNPRLAGSRKALMDELDSDPALRRDVLKTASMENRGSPFKMQAVLESMVNRAKMNGYSSLRQAIHSGFYGPVNRGGLSGALSEKDRRDGEAALKQVREGSNAIGYRTDQGMLTDPGARRYLREPDHSGHRVIGGENFFYMGRKGREWARRQEAADAAQPNPAVAGGRRPEVLADPRDERRIPEGELKQLRPWIKRHPAEGGLKPTLVDMDDDGGMYGGTGVLKGKDDAFEAWLKRMHEEEAKNPISKEQLEQQRRAQDRDAFVDAMKERAGRGVQYGHAEGEAPPTNSMALRDLNRMQEANRKHAEETWGDTEDLQADKLRKLQGRSNDPAYQPKRDLTLDEIRRFRAPDAARRSPRFMDPASYQLKPGAGGDQNSGAAGSGRFGLGGPAVTQHFHGGFDAHEVGRRAQLEQNREVRRTMAGALHDVGHPVSV